MSRELRVLRVLSVLEILTLAVLLGNLATVHLPEITSAVGPIHGSVYLLVVIAALTVSGAPLRPRLYALVPAVGGLLATRSLGRHRPSGPARPGSCGGRPAGWCRRDA
jgi:hypothetical protein